MLPVRLVTLEPGHFHAALVQKEMYADVAPQAHVYAPLGPDLVAHLQRLAGFNSRPTQPTAWELEVHTGPDAAGRLFRERPGNVLVLSGRNRPKIDHLVAAAEAGLHVLADKPWIIASSELPRLEAALATAAQKGLVFTDIMTERHEITSILQRELVNDPEVFGDAEAGNERNPAIVMESVHYLVKQVAGVPLRRPAWFFDIAEQGEGLADVGTHLVDLVAWIAFPERTLDYRTDVEILAARRWPSVLSLDEFTKATGETAFPAYLAEHVRDGQLDYFCNNAVTYRLGGRCVHLDVLWKVKAAAGAGDTHFARFRGRRSAVEVRQGKKEQYRPELHVVPRRAADRADVAAALGRRIQALQERYPGVGLEDTGRSLWVTIPDTYRVGHEAHFAEVTRQFLGYLKAPQSVPAWETPNLLAKYCITTGGVERSRQAPAASEPPSP